MDDHYIGKHCSDSTCKQRDYMPIQCKFCKKVYCTNHYSILSHDCPKKDQDKKEVFSCPFCNKILPVNQNLTIEENLSVHEAMDCTFKFQQPKKVPLCATNKCKTKLSEFNMYQCRQCYKKLCLKHRMAESHQCVKA